MMLTEQSQIPLAALPMAGFKDHLKLGSGFADDGAQDGLIERLLRSAISAIEARTGKILILRTFLWELDSWREAEEQALPIAPVMAISSLTLVDAMDAETVVAPERYALMVDTHRPKLLATGAALPTIPNAGRAEVVMQAGFGADWSAVPYDLAQAVFLLGAHYYDNRSEAEMTGMRGLMPSGVNALIQRYKTVRLLGGRA